VSQDEIVEQLVRLENGIASNATDTVWVSCGQTASERIWQILEEMGASEALKRLSIYQEEKV